MKLRNIGRVIIEMDTHPECDIRPKVGFKPITPHRAAGIRTDPRQTMPNETSY